MQLHHRGRLHRREICVGFLVPPQLQGGGGAVVADIPQDPLAAQCLRQPLGNRIVAIHVGVVQEVRVEIAEKQLGAEHGVGIALRRRQVVGLLQQGDGGLALLIGVDSRHEVEVGARVELQSLLVAILHHPLQGQLPPVEVRLQHRGRGGEGREQKPLQNGRVQRQGTLAQLGERRFQFGAAAAVGSAVAGEHGLVALVHQRLPRLQLLVVPGQGKAGKELAEDFTAGLHLSLLDLGEVRHGADSAAKPLLAPIPLKTRLAQQRAGNGSVHPHPSFVFYQCTPRSGGLQLSAAPRAPLEGSWLAKRD